MQITQNTSPPRAIVLIADGEMSVGQLVCTAPARQSYRVILVSDGKQGLVTAAQHDYQIDLLVTDVILAGFYGCHLAELLKFDYPQLKVIYLASFIDRDVCALSRESKVILLQHPDWADALVAAVRDELAAQLQRGQAGLICPPRGLGRPER